MTAILRACVTAAFMDSICGPGRWVYCTVHEHGPVWHHRDHHPASRRETMTLQNDPEWNEPSPDVVARLEQWGCFAADAVLMGPHPPWTGAEETRQAIRAALRVLLANGVMEALLPSETEGRFIQLDPPGGWNPPSGGEPMKIEPWVRASWADWDNRGACPPRDWKWEQEDGVVVAYYRGRGE